MSAAKYCMMLRYEQKDTFEVSRIASFCFVDHPLASVHTFGRISYLMLLIVS